VVQKVEKKEKKKGKTRRGKGKGRGKKEKWLSTYVFSIIILTYWSTE
jgi:hypothetical protein